MFDLMWTPISGNSAEIENCCCALICSLLTQRHTDPLASCAITPYRTCCSFKFFSKEVYAFISWQVCSEKECQAYFI